MCLYPKLIRNKKYTANKTNEGNIPKCKDKRVLYVPAGCGKCMECRKQKARQWQVRLQEDIRTNTNAKFVTWTFDEKSLIEIEKKVTEEHREVIKELEENNDLKQSRKRNKEKYLSGYNRDNEVCRYAIRKYTERWRKKYGKTLRHWIVSEIGGKNTERVHLHGIVWTNEIESIKERWKYGGVYIGEYVNAKTINYIVKYVNKVDEKHKEYVSKIYTSKGIGKEYIKRKDSNRNKYKKEEETIETYKTRNGMELALPTYYRNKIYNEEEREELWLQKLDKQERWIDGVKIDISKGEEEYYKVLKEARRKNKRLGYGNNNKNWEKKKYENERRNLKRIERVKKLYG